MAYKPDWLNTGRKGEVIGGGFVVMRRERETGRVRPSLHPFEYDNQVDAEQQALKLAQMHPDYAFEIFRGVGVKFAAVVNADTTETA